MLCALPFALARTRRYGGRPSTFLLDGKPQHLNARSGSFFPLYGECLLCARNQSVKSINCWGLSVYSIHGAHLFRNITPGGGGLRFRMHRPMDSELEGNVSSSWRNFFRVVSMQLFGRPEVTTCGLVCFIVLIDGARKQGTFSLCVETEGDVCSPPKLVSTKCQSMSASRSRHAFVTGLIRQGAYHRIPFAVL